ncbi:hypothetical protein MAPG_08191 [Magnaporthiopsis poae ATCC 64411]|uniref:Pentatricopeptide repeat domain-containing protein n=1 Tax=Magnaporthiopsis poae (strain ATCC 64411 / 73-15) TaxID=644358 RepID=A0A0C4E6P5_MAGP6|nr:hypothetical protein MAPG_08191 [Magnaporthiopsis poae ATCC 64411]
MTLAPAPSVGISGPSRLLHNPPWAATAPSRALRLGFGHLQPSLVHRYRTSHHQVRHASHVSDPHDGAVLGARLVSQPTPSGGKALDPAFMQAVLGQQLPGRLRRQVGPRGEADEASMPYAHPPPQTLPKETFADRFRRALREADVLVLWELLNRVTEPDEEYDPLPQVVGSLSADSFSELLRLLEPDNVQRQLHGDGNRLFISAGMVATTPLGSLVDELGRRRTYLTLYDSLTKLCQIREPGSGRLMPSDFKILLRSAGATMDLYKVKRIWGQYLRSVSHAKTADMMTEYIKARFFTDPLFSQYDISRFRVYPLNLNRKKFLLGRVRFGMLEKMRLRTARTRHDRFGQNAAAHKTAVRIDKMLSKAGPLRKLVDRNVNQGYIEEEQACALLIAMSRTSSNRDKTNLLVRTWGVMPMSSLSALPAQLVEDPSALRERFRWPGAVATPTQRLLLAVMRAYCAMADVPMALSAVDTLSRVYNIDIPDNLWFELLEWVYTLSSYPARQEWELMSPLLVNKVMTTESLLQIWEVMTSARYNVQPGVAQYFILAKSLLAKGETVVAVELMEKMVQQYDSRVGELEAAAVEAAHAKALGLDQARSKRRYHEAVLSKWTLWFYIHRCATLLLKAARRNGGEAHNAWAATRLVPDCIAAFERFLPREVEYKVATGLVTLDLRRTVGAQSYGLVRETFEAPPTIPVQSTTTWYMPFSKRRQSLWRKNRERTRRISRDVFPSNLTSTFDVPANTTGQIGSRWVERQFA